MQWQARNPVRWVPFHLRFRGSERFDETTESGAELSIACSAPSTASHPTELITGAGRGVGFGANYSGSRPRR